ncbi:hypothetical protein RvVAT039_18040 [Agrobacterium vitis]|nr:hypothetical protein RvVAT039_18040 [Agrobacterium vitis]
MDPGKAMRCMEMLQLAMGFEKRKALQTRQSGWAGTADDNRWPVMGQDCWTLQPKGAGRSAWIDRSLPLSCP